MNSKILKQIKENIHSNNSITLNYFQLSEWYELEGFNIDEILELNITLEGEEYFLEIWSGNDCIVDEIITNEDTGNMADWLFNRN